MTKKTRVTAAAVLMAKQATGVRKSFSLEDRAARSERMKARNAETKRIRSENDTLRAENARLQAENEKLKNQ